MHAQSAVKKKRSDYSSICAEAYPWLTSIFPFQEQITHASRDPIALGWFTVEHRSLAADVCRRST
jgi:hypothetical protein